MKQEHKDYILAHIGRKTVKQLAKELSIRERKIRHFLKRYKSDKGTLYPFRLKAVFLSVLLIAVLGFAIYANSLKGDFLWDDLDLVKNNPYIRSFSHLSLAFTANIGAGVGKRGHFWRPLQVLSYIFDYSFWKLNPLGFRLSNILLHILAAISVYFLVLVFFKDNLLGLFTGLLFVVHPVHTEAVSYISGRADSLAAVFMLWSLIFYARNDHHRKPSLYILMLLSYLFALLSREGAIIFPVLILVYHLSFSRRMKFKDFAPFIGLSLAYIILRLTLLRSILPGLENCPYSLLTRLPGVFVALAGYCRLLIAPFGLHMEYGYKLFDWVDPKAIAGVVILLLLLVFMVRKRSRDRVIFFGLTWSLAAFLPVSGLYPINAYMSEHWLYIPSIGVFLIIAHFLSKLSRGSRGKVFAFLALAGLLGFYSILTIGQNVYWSDPVKLYRKTLEYVPDSPKVYNNLGLIYYQQDEKEKALDMFKKAVEVEPEYVGGYSNIANFYKAQGSYDQAIVFYKKALELDPRFLYAYNNLGLTYMDMGRYPEAVPLFKKVIELNPYYIEAYNSLGTTFVSMGKPQEAIKAYRKAIELNPAYPNAYHNLGIAYNSIGKPDEAISLFKKTISLDPGHAQAYNNLAIIYANKQDFEQALKYYEKAKALGFDNPSLEKVLERF